MPVAPTAATWRQLGQLLNADHGVHGNLIPDTWLAAPALSHGATLVTRDGGFARFAGLSLVSPSAGR